MTDQNKPNVVATAIILLIIECIIAILIILNL